MKYYIFIIYLFLYTNLFGQDKIFDPVELGNATAKISDNQLIISTGEMERRWSFTSSGLKTNNLKLNDKDWIIKSNDSCDWFSENSADLIGTLINAKAEVANDEGFTSDHIRVSFEYFYPYQNAYLDYMIWVYPDAPGLRVQIGLKSVSGKKITEHFINTITTEKVNTDTKWNEIFNFGYYVHTQARNKPETDLLLESRFNKNPEFDFEINWANGSGIIDDDNGFLIIKESHKAVNQPGANTGSFYFEKNQVSSKGLGLTPALISDEEYHYGWANWQVLYEGSAADRELAVKKFDRIRYPVDPERDIYILANTWGSGNTLEQSEEASRESNILREIESQKDLGIDVQQIDDGWQNPPGTHWWDTEFWKPHTSRYPEGWANVKAKANELGIEMGLWAAAEMIELQDLKYNFNKGGFLYYKLDFADLTSYDKVEDLIQKIRDFILYTNHKIRVNWDVTENWPRVGYFFARDLGNLYLENRKPNIPESVIYKPHLVLRDAWQVSKYVNLNKVQVSIQNIDRVNKEKSDAYQHTHPYVVAIALMSSPIFFQETHYYTNEARQQIKPLIDIYKKYRNEMYKGFVFPIGDEPDNTNWTGFQNHNPETNEGFLLIFRELHNELKEKKMKLNFVNNRSLEIKNLINGESYKVRSDDTGNLKFSIDNSPGFLFLKYKIQN